MSRADRPTFIVRLRPEPGVDAVRALRSALKVLLRRFGLRCVEVRKVQKEEPGLSTPHLLELVVEP
jgi:hypothetical protein